MPRKKVEKPAPCRLIPLKDAAAMMGRSRFTVRDWVQDGRIASHLIFKRILIPESEIERIAAESYRPRVA